MEFAGDAKGPFAVGRTVTDSKAVHGRVHLRLAPATAWWLVMAAITLVAALIRLSHLGAESIWFDEASTWAATRVPVKHFVRVLVEHEVSPPLYFVLMKGWTSVAGDSEVVLRLPSALVGTLTVLILGWLSRGVVGAGPALAGSVLLALSPFHIWYSQEARSYALYTFLILLATIALAVAWESNQRQAWLVYFLSLLAACYTHYFAVYFLVAHASFVAVASLSSVRTSLAHQLLLSRRRIWTVGTATVGVVFLPWLILKSPRHPWSGGNWIQQLWVNTAPLLQLWETTRSIFLGDWYPFAARNWVHLGIIILIGGGMLPTLGKGNSNASGLRIGPMPLSTVVLVPSVVAWAVSQFWPSMIPRYLIPILPAALILVGIGIWRIRSTALRVLVVSALAIGQILSLQHQIREHMRPDVRGLSAYLRACAQPGDGLVVEEWYNTLVFRYYMRDTLPVVVDLLKVKRSSDHEKALELQLAPLKRLWFVKIRNPGDEDTLRLYLDTHYPVTDIGEVFWQIQDVKLYSLAPGTPTGGNACRGRGAG